VVRRRLESALGHRAAHLLLFIKRLDEPQTIKEDKASRARKPIEEPIPTAKQDKLRSGVTSRQRWEEIGKPWRRRMRECWGRVTADRLLSSVRGVQE